MFSMNFEGRAPFKLAQGSIWTSSAKLDVTG